MVSYEVVTDGKKVRCIGYTLAEVKRMYRDAADAVTIWCLRGIGDGMFASIIEAWHKPDGHRRFHRGAV